jgi:lipoprotein-releasing system permease protein
MRVELFLAKRFAVSLRHDVFTFVATTGTTLSIALGYVAVCVAISILQGYSEKIIETATMFSSDVIVRSQYAVDFEDPGPILQRIRSLPNVRDVTIALEREALAKHNGQLDGVLLNGIDLPRYAVFAQALTSRDTSRHLQTGVVIGCGLSHTLRANVGDSITLIFQKKGATVPGVRKVRVVGVFESGMGSQDENVALLHIDSLRAYSGSLPAAASVVMVKANVVDHADQVAQEIRHIYTSSAFVSTYKEVFQGVWGWIEMQRKPIPIVLGLLSIVAVVSIVSSLLLTIVQKTRSIAILATLGLSSRRIGYVVLLRACTSALLGVLIGGIITVVFVYGQSTYSWIQLDSTLYYVSVLPVHFDPVLALLIAIGIILLTVVVSLVPMAIARRITPARALRFS